MKIRMQSFVERGNKLIKAGKQEGAIDLMLNGFEYYSKRIINAISPYSKTDAGMIVIVLRHIAKQIEKNNPGAEEFAEQMSKILVFPELLETEKIQKPNKE